MEFHGNTELPQNFQGKREHSALLAARFIGDNALSVIADGDMGASGTGAWTALNSAGLSKQDDGGNQILRVAFGGVATPAASQPLVVGVNYQFTGRARGDGTQAPRLSASGTVWAGSTSTEWQAFDVDFVATANAVELRSFGAGTWGTYVEWDDVQVKPVTSGDDLLAYWALDETQGAVANNTAGGVYPPPYAGTISGGVTLGTPSPVEGDAHGMTFDGVNGTVIDVPDSGAMVGAADESFSVSAWVTQSELATAWGMIAGTFEGPPFWYFNTSAGAGSASVNFAFNSTNCLSPPITAGALVHVVGVCDRDADLTTVYVDGVPNTPVDISAIGSVLSPDFITIGGTRDAKSAWKGDIFNIAIFGRALTQADVDYLYAAGAP